MLNDFGAERIRTLVILVLVARTLLVVLFLVIGWQKLTQYAGTAEYFTQVGVPVPAVAVIISIVMEFFLGLAIVLGAKARTLAVLRAFYTLITGFLGHHYSTVTGMAQTEAMINFYKKVSIMGGLFLL